MFSNSRQASFYHYLCLKLVNMELTANLKEQIRIAAFLNMMKEMDYIEIVNVKEYWINFQLSLRINQINGCNE